MQIYARFLQRFNAVVEQQLRRGVQTSDQALAQEIALTTSLQLKDDMNSLASLGNLVAQDPLSDMRASFQTYQAARNDVDYLYWLDPVGDL